MSNEDKRVDEQVRLAVEALPPAPVRWDRVVKKARRRRWIGLVLLILLSVVLTVVVATGFLAGKSALDPTYSPPLVSRDDLSVEFNEPDFGYGRTSLASYRQNYSPFTGDPRGLDPQSLGYVVSVTLDGVNNDGQFIPRWQMRSRSSSESLALTALPSEVAHRNGETGNENFTAWIEQPSRSGQFVVDFSVAWEGETLASESSSPIHVVNDDMFTPYDAPSYAAALPKGWTFKSDYDDEPGRRFVTRLEGPHGMSILVDTTLGVSGDPADSARNLEALFAGGEESYKRLGFARQNMGGPAFEWSFEVGDNVSTDIFFYREGSGYAVLAESPARRFREARSIARYVARSVSGPSG